MRYKDITRGGHKTRLHTLVAERALGKPLPSGALVHHADGDKLNNDPTNLVICPDDSYHQLLHKRMRAVAACGNPSFRICTFCKRYDDPAAMAFSGRQHYHAICQREYRRERRVAAR